MEKRLDECDGTRYGALRSKKERVLKLLRREKGATISEIATDWKSHSIRDSFAAGEKRQVKKKMKLIQVF